MLDICILVDSILQKWYCKLKGRDTGDQNKSCPEWTLGQPLSASVLWPEEKYYTHSYINHSMKILYVSRNCELYSVCKACYYLLIYSFTYGSRKPRGFVQSIYIVSYQFPNWLSLVFIVTHYVNFGAPHFRYVSLTVYNIRK